MFPVFHVFGRESGPAGLNGTVTLTTCGPENWVGDQHLGYLKAGPTLIFGRWHQKAEIWTFVPENPDNLELLITRPEWEILDGYWGSRAEIVLDETLQWQKTSFQQTDSVRHNADGSSEVIKDGWDHEHCAICWETIGRGRRPEGYLSDELTWVCEPCYVAFITQRSLDFIPSY
jgi:hypothetical protein